MWASLRVLYPGVGLSPCVIPGLVSRTVLITRVGVPNSVDNPGMGLSVWFMPGMGLSVWFMPGWYFRVLIIPGWYLRVLIIPDGEKRRDMGPGAGERRESEQCCAESSPVLPVPNYQLYDEKGTTLGSGPGNGRDVHNGEHTARLHI